MDREFNIGIVLTAIFITLVSSVVYLKIEAMKEASSAGAVAQAGAPESDPRSMAVTPKAAATVAGGLVREVTQPLARQLGGDVFKNSWFTTGSSSRTTSADDVMPPPAPVASSMATHPPAPPVPSDPPAVRPASAQGMEVAKAPPGPPTPASATDWSPLGPPPAPPGSHSGNPAPTARVDSPPVEPPTLPPTVSAPSPAPAAPAAPPELPPPGPPQPTVVTRTEPPMSGAPPAPPLPVPNEPPQPPALSPQANRPAETPPPTIPTGPPELPQTATPAGPPAPPPGGPPVPAPTVPSETLPPPTAPAAPSGPPPAGPPPASATSASESMTPSPPSPPPPSAPSNEPRPPAGPTTATTPPTTPPAATETNRAGQPVRIRPQPDRDLPAAVDGTPVVRKSEGTVSTLGSGNPTHVEYFDLKLHRPRTGDSYASIAKEQYGSVHYEAALAAFNRDRDARLDTIAPGRPVYVPPVEVLRRRYGNLIGTENTLPAPPPSGPPAGPSPLSQYAPPSGPPDILPASGSVREAPSGPAPRPATRSAELPRYRVRTDDSLYIIAKKTLGDGERWRDIWKLNQDILKGSTQIEIGMVLKLPGDAKVSEQP